MYNILLYNIIYVYIKYIYILLNCYQTPFTLIFNNKCLFYKIYYQNVFYNQHINKKYNLMNIKVCDAKIII